MAVEGVCDDFLFQCKSGRCIIKEFVCDGSYDCGEFDFSDEEECEGSFLCLLVRPKIRRNC